MNNVSGFSTKQEPIQSDDIYENVLRVFLLLGEGNPDFFRNSMICAFSSFIYACYIKKNGWIRSTGIRTISWISYI